MEQTMRPSIPGWMASVVFGTYFGAWSFATVRGVLSGSIAKWLLLLAVCSALAALQVAVLGFVDLMLLWLKVRRLPNGRSAWTGSVLAAFIVGMVGSMFVRFGSPVGVIASVFVPMIAVSAATRLAVGERC